MAGRTGDRESWGEVRIGSRYVAVAVLGHGSFGTVFRSDGPEGPVAVKLLRPDLAADHQVVNRFLRERALLLRLRHRNIAAVRDLVAEGDVLALVMDLVDGPDLRALLRRRGPMPAPEAARLVGEIAAALSYAHAEGVVHRDVKPENVLLRGDTPLLVDFGIARLVGSAATAGGDQGVLGTPAYLAPEVALGRPATPAADVYACGALLCEAVTGATPFAAEHPLSMVHAHVTQAPLRPEGMPEQLWRVAAACLAKEPAERPDADTLRALLSDWAAHPGAVVTQAAHAAQASAGAAQPPHATQTSPHASQTSPHATRAMPRAAEATPVGARRQDPATGQPQLTQALPNLAPGDWQHRRGVARVSAEAPASSGDVDDDWRPATASPRRTWPLHVASLLAVAAVFFAAGFWTAGFSGGDADPPPRSGKSPAAPSAPPSEPAKPQPRYLSDMPFTQIANGHGPVELDRANGENGPDDGPPLTLGGKEHERGLGTHAPSHVRVRPPSGCTEFKAAIGVDAVAAAASAGSVGFQVHVDGEIRHDSGVLTWQAAPRQITVDVAGASMVDLVVTDGGDGNAWDHADWADARLICE